MCTEHPGESNFNLCAGERRSKPQTGRIDHALMCPYALLAGVRTGMGEARNGTRPRAHSSMHTPTIMSEPGGSSTGVLNRKFRDGTRRVPMRGWGSRGGEHSSRILLALVGTRAPPAGYGHQCPQFTAPRVWWDSTTTTDPCASICIASLFPRGGSYRRPCRGEVASTWGGDVTL